MVERYRVELLLWLVERNAAAETGNWHASSPSQPVTWSVKHGAS